MAMELTEYGKLLESFRKREEGARLSNLARKDQVSKIYQDIIKRYEPGGAFGAGYEAQLQRQKVGDVSRGEQQDIGRGLYGIRNRGAEWEATTGSSARLKLEDLRMERLSGAQTGMAGFLERIEEPYPDYSALMAASQAQGGMGYGGGRAEARPAEDITGKLAAARSSNWAFQGLGGGGYSGGGGYTPGQSTGGGGSAGVYGLSTTGDPLAGAGKMQFGEGATGTSYDQAMAARKGITYEQAMGSKPKLNFYKWLQQQGHTGSRISGSEEDLALRKQWQASQSK